MKTLLFILIVAFQINLNAQSTSLKLAKWEAGNKQVDKNTENGRDTYSFCFQNKEYSHIIDIKCVSFSDLQSINKFANFLDSLLEIPLQKDQTMSGIKYRSFELSISTLMGRNLITFYPNPKLSDRTWLGKKDVKEFRKLAEEKK